MDKTLIEPIIWREKETNSLDFMGFFCMYQSTTSKRRFSSASVRVSEQKNHFILFFFLLWNPRRRRTSVFCPDARWPSPYESGPGSWDTEEGWDDTTAWVDKRATTCDIHVKREFTPPPSFLLSQLKVKEALTDTYVKQTCNKWRGAYMPLNCRL